MKTNDGYKIVQGRRFGNEEFYRRNGVYAYLSYIPYTYTSSLKVYFVSGSNGDEYGQFPTKNQALEKARRMAKLSEKQRKRYDE